MRGVFGLDREEKKESNLQESLAWKVIKGQFILNIFLGLIIIIIVAINSYERLQYDYVGETSIEQKTDQGGDVSSIISKEGVNIGVPSSKYKENEN